MGNIQTSTTHRVWNVNPIIQLIASFGNAKDHVRFGACNRRFQKLLEHPNVWPDKAVATVTQNSLSTTWGVKSWQQLARAGMQKIQHIEMSLALPPGDWLYIEKWAATLKSLRLVEFCGVRNAWMAYLPHVERVELESKYWTVSTATFNESTGRFELPQPFLQKQYFPSLKQLQLTMPNDGFGCYSTSLVDVKLAEQLEQLELENVGRFCFPPFTTVQSIDGKEMRSSDPLVLSNLQVLKIQRCALGGIEVTEKLHTFAFDESSDMVYFSNGRSVQDPDNKNVDYFTDLDKWNQAWKQHAASHTKKLCCFLFETPLIDNQAASRSWTDQEHLNFLMRPPQITCD